MVRSTLDNQKTYMRAASNILLLYGMVRMKINLCNAIGMITIVVFGGILLNFVLLLN